jgi:hypothetical protein
MAILGVQSTGNWEKTRTWAHKILHRDFFNDLDRYGQMGVAALAAATPIESAQTANSWYYVIRVNSKGHPQISWHNDHLDPSGTPVAVLIQYGHRTGTGGYVQGRDFINPAILPIFQQIADDIWEKVTAS